MADDSGAIIGIVVTLVIIAAIVFVLSQTIFIVKQGEAIVVERLGRFSRILTPGINCLVPFLDAPKQFKWSKAYVGRDGKVREDKTVVTRVDLRETLFNFPRQDVYTVDTVQMSVNAVMYYRIKDVHKAVYQVDDLTNAVQNVAQAQLKDVFGYKTMSAVLQGQKAVNEHLQTLFSKEFADWGLEVYRIELLELSPLAHSQTATAMKEQMKAERERRAEFIEAEGNKTATRLESEGEKLRKTNLGVAEQEATRKKSEGAKTAKIELARAETTALQAIAEVVEEDGCSQTDFALFNKFNDFMRESASRATEKTVYLPYDASAVTGLLRRLPKAYGKSTGAEAPPPVAAGRRGGPDADAALD